MLNDPTAGLILAATDLTDRLACEHLTEQRRLLALGRRSAPHAWDDPHGDLIRERGDAHEKEQLERLIEVAGGDWVDLAAGAPYPRTADELAASHARTARAMREGVRLLFQAGLFDGRWQGRADFLRRVARPSALGDWSYEVIDTKLARHVRPATVHQLALYSRLVASVQGLAPVHAHVILGDGAEVPVALGRYAALHRHRERRLEATVAAGDRVTYPEPTAHCDICRFARECERRRRADDHLALVAGASRTHRARLEAAAVSTLAALADLDPATPVSGLAAERVDALQHQAALQRESRESGLPVHRHLDPQAERGYARLPAPSPGDLFFDLEGDPYLDSEGGVEFLWGWCDTDGAYEHRWAHDRAGERAALVAFIERVEAARDEHPDMHVFHYAPHEASALARLAMRHGVGEDTIDTWLRAGVLVDLYGVVRQGMQVGEEGYSLKDLERHHGFRRLERSVRAGGGAIATFENWRATGDPALLQAIRDYNREDCVSTAGLYRWLWTEMRPEAARRFAVDFGTLLPPDATTFEAPPWLAEVEALRDRLHAGLPADPAGDDTDAAERRLVGHLLLYHHRENKPQWWDWFRINGLSPEELVDERAAVGLLRLDESVAPRPHKRSLDWTLRFPAQETKLALGQVRDPLTGDGFTLVDITEDTLVLRRGAKFDPPRPTALTGGSPIDATALRTALVEIGADLVDGDGTRFPALRALLRGDPPALDATSLRPEVPALVEATLALRHTTLPVQGPPGTGKTYAGARMIVAAIAAGRRVAITANSHAAIQNLLAGVEECAAERGVAFRGAYKGDGYTSPCGMVEEVDNAAAEAGDHDLVAGTAWLLARPAFRADGPRFDLLFVDEAGQMALAAALAAGTAADSLVLLGDPRQLPQVNQADHPEGAGASVLEHVLAGADTVPPDRGVLLEVSWRMHPAVCEFVSEQSYGGRLSAHPDCALRRLDVPVGALSGAGLRVIEVAHEGRSQESPEEAAAIGAACRDLLAGGARVVGRDGADRPLEAADIMVVAPFNMAVQCIRRAVPDGVRVGTVDRFQGQEAPVVFFAMTCSSGEEVPRGLGFLFDRNRLNVAVSRAQCLAVLVHSPRLLDVDCRTLDEMALVDGACRFAEVAGG